MEIKENQHVDRLDNNLCRLFPDNIYKFSIITLSNLRCCHSLCSRTFSLRDSVVVVLQYILSFTVLLEIQKRWNKSVNKDELIDIKNLKSVEDWNSNSTQVFLQFVSQGFIGLFVL